jgi:ferredoxin
MIEGTKALLARLAVPAAQVHSEAFAAAVAGARAPVPAPEPEREPEELVTVAAPARPAAGGPVTSQLTVRGKTVMLTSGQTLLEGAEAARVAIPNVCRAGVCGTCKTRLVSGEVECTADAMEGSYSEEGYVFPCMSWAKGDCVLDA